MSFRIVPNPSPAPLPSPAVSAREAAERNPVFRVVPVIALCAVCHFEREREGDRWAAACLRPECDAWLDRQVAA